MTETEYVISIFPERFRMFRDKKIVLHGSRNYAQEIIRNFGDDFRFLGVMSREDVGSPEFCGLPVLNENDIPFLEIDMIILTERVKYAEAVYRDIHKLCRKKGILLYNMYGLNEFETHSELIKCKPLNIDEWSELCKDCQVVAFEAMDTLLTGPDLVIRDVFRELIRKLISQGIEVLVSLRKSYSAEKQINALKATGLFPSLDSFLIYRQGEDLSFRRLREENPGKKILYIGNGVVNEFLLPRCYGIDTYRFTDSFSFFGMPVPEEEPVRIPYDEKRKEKILQAIRESMVVSFDVFDTLLIRKTLRPEDVFELTEHRAEAAGYPVEVFADMRKNAEQYTGCSTIYDIYDLLRDSLCWSDELTQTMLQLELEVENDVTVPRTEVVELLDFAVKEGKTVVLTSDMYLPELVFRDLLSKKGIRSYDRLFVSCDHNCSKRSGLLKEVCMLAENPETVLHIGDDLLTDIQAAASCGIRTEYIPSVSALASERGWASSIKTAAGLMERCLLGMSIAELFRDPFQNPNLSELTTEKRLRRYASGVVGPLAAGYMTWLVKQLRKCKYDGVLFLARDGYLPVHIYRELDLEPPLPPAVYYYANRHSTFLCCADDESRIPEMIGHGKVFDLCAAEILKRVFNLSENEILPPVAGESESNYILRHMPAIEKRAEKARKVYREYSERCGVNENGIYAVVDCFSAGTTQRNMESFLSCRLQGFYFGNYTNNHSNNAIDSYLNSGNTTIIKNYIELESFFSSPEPAISYLEENGTVIFADEPRTAEEIDEYYIVFSDAFEYAKEFFRLFYIEGNVIRPELPEEMFAAEGYHGVQSFAYDDLCKEKIGERAWQIGT